MHLLEYIANDWDAFVGWLETLVGHHKAGTLPASGVTVTISPHDPVPPEDKTPPLGAPVPPPVAVQPPVQPVAVPVSNPNPLDFPNDNRMLSHYASPATPADFIGEPDVNGMVSVSHQAFVDALRERGAKNSFAIADTFYAFPNLGAEQKRKLETEIAEANAKAALGGNDRMGRPANCGYGYAFSNGDLDPAHRGVWLRNFAEAIPLLPIPSDNGPVAGPGHPGHQEGKFEHASEAPAPAPAPHRG